LAASERSLPPEQLLDIEMRELLEGSLTNVKAEAAIGWKAAVKNERD
jgi:hypothetical protein